MAVFGMSGATKPGIMQMYAGNAAPDGWLICDGAAVSRTLYAELFAAIGTAYGAGDGTTTFNIPNLVNQFPEGNGQGYEDAGLPNITGSAHVSGQSVLLLIMQENLRQLMEIRLLLLCRTLLLMLLEVHRFMAILQLYNLQLVELIL